MSQLSKVKQSPGYDSIYLINFCKCSFYGSRVFAQCSVHFCWNNKDLSVSTKQKQLHLQNKGHWSCYFWGALTENSVQNNKLWKKRCLEIFQDTEVHPLDHKNQCQVYNSLNCPCELDLTHSFSYSTQYILHISMSAGDWQITTYLACG